MIRFERFGWRFADGADWALRDISLSIEKGEFVVITGPSGSGKSTLALAMCGLLIGRQAGKSEGTVTVAGECVATTPLHRLAESVGLVQQNPDAHFATLTVHDEIVFGLENRCVERAEIVGAAAQAMSLLNIAHLRDRSLFTLSGGEKQRVAVASMLAGEPRVLVLDEPSASLDPEASRDLFRVLANLCHRMGVTVVVIEHKLVHLLPLQPRVIRLDLGRVTIDASGEDAGRALPEVMGRPGDALPIWNTPTAGDENGRRVAELRHVVVEADDHSILKGVSVEVNAGDVIAVLGPNGGGKSTLLHCLSGLVKPIVGSVRVADVWAPSSHVSRMAASVGFVFQNADHQLVADTIRREALFTADRLRMVNGDVEIAADRLLGQAGLAARKPDHPYRLSWGQKRRLNLISAVLHQPRLVLLDEPFAGQDWENVAFLLAVIRDTIRVSPTLANESAVQRHRGACLIVTHDPRVVVRICNRVLFLADGRIILDTPLPEAFDRLVEMGYDAYVPTDWAVTRRAACPRSGVESVQLRNEC